jgi:cytochrome c oxidase subunit 1
MTGRMMSERLGRWSFWLVLVGFHLTFFPMHVLGLQGMPRRVYTYLPERGWENLNLLATLGAGVLGVGVLIFVCNALGSLRRGESAGADPWAAPSLEWATGSPPPVYNFQHIPVVTGRQALWSDGALVAFVGGLDPDHPEVLVTNVLDAEPELRCPIAGPSIWPFWTAVATAATWIGLMFTPWAIVPGVLILFVTLLGWIVKPSEEHEGSEAATAQPAPATS